MTHNISEYIIYIHISNEIAILLNQFSTWISYMNQMINLELNHIMHDIIVVSNEKLMLNVYDKEFFMKAL